MEQLKLHHLVNLITVLLAIACSHPDLYGQKVAMNFDNQTGTCHIYCQNNHKSDTLFSISSLIIQTGEQPVLTQDDTSFVLVYKSYWYPFSYFVAFQHMSKKDGESIEFYQFPFKERFAWNYLNVSSQENSVFVTFDFCEKNIEIFKFNLSEDHFSSIRGSMFKNIGKIHGK